MSLGARRRRPPTPRFVANELWRRAGEVPSFHIAPARTQNATDLITGNLLGSYNSASPALAVGPDGVLALPAANAPVIEYDPTTGACLGARIWEVVVNLSLQSRDLTQAAWTKSGVTPTRDQVGANGVSNTATRLTATSSDGTCLQTITSASATRVSGFYIRRITGTGTVEITQNGGATWTAVSLTGTFARYSIASATIANPQIGFRIRSNGDEIAVDFAQLQSASTLGPPVATTTLAASSTADVWSIAGVDFSRIYNPNETTIYLDAFGFASGGRIYFDDGIGISDRFDLRFNNSNWGMFSIGGGVGDGSANSGNSNPTARMAGTIAADGLAISVNGAAVVTDTSITMPQNISQMWIGSFRGSAAFANGYIRELAIFRSRRPNANLQAMTS